MTNALATILFITLTPVLVIMAIDIFDKYYYWDIKGEDLIFWRK